MNGCGKRAVDTVNNNVKAGIAGNLQRALPHTHRGIMALDLARRLLQHHAAVTGRKLTRHRHAVLPAAHHGGCVAIGRLIGHAHPADQNVATVLGRELLRSIEVKTGVPQAKLAQLIGTVTTGNVARYRHVTSSVYVAAIPTTTLEPLGREGQELRRHTVIGLKLKVSRAFPHKAKTLGRRNTALELPTQHIGRAIHQDLAHIAPGTLAVHRTKTALDMRPIHATTRAQHHVVTPIIIAPHLGVTYMAGQILGIILGRQHHALLVELPTGMPINALHIDGIGAAAGIDVVVRAVRIGKLNIACVQHANAVVFGKRGARIYAMAIERLVGQQWGANVVPRHKVAARRMTPDLNAALDIKGRILKISVKYAIRLAKTVGVVEPARRRHNVEALAIRAMAALRGGNVNSGNQLCKVAAKCIRHIKVLTDRKLQGTRDRRPMLETPASIQPAGIPLIKSS